MNNTTISISEQFQKFGYILIENFIDPNTIKIISKYMENKIQREEWTGGDDQSSYCYYSDPLIEVILDQSLNQVSNITGKELLPTYSYMRIYAEGDELKKHVDRPSCEISLTVNVAYIGEPSPIFLMSRKNDKPISYILNKGDAIVYKGCEIVHWRNPVEKNNIVVQFMLHYVDKYGEFKNHKFDSRTRLGLPRGKK